MTPQDIAGFRIPKEQAEGLKAALADAGEVRVSVPAARLGRAISPLRPRRTESRPSRRAA